MVVKAVHNQISATRLARVFLQLDSYITAQFCGVCVGIQNGLYSRSYMVSDLKLDLRRKCAPLVDLPLDWPADMR